MKKFQIVPDSSGEGVIVSNPSREQQSGRKNHFITWFYTTIEEIVPVIERCKLKCYKGTYQTEECPSTKRKHIHMMLWSHKKFRDTELKIPKRDGKHTYRAEKLEDVNNTSNYANKDDPSFDGIMRGSWGFPLEPEVLDRKDFYPFQEQIVRMMEGPVNKNKVVWIYDKKGQNGKSDVMRWIHHNWKWPFTYGGNCGDIINLVYNAKDWIQQQEKPGLIYNLTRTQKPRHISYKSMEEVCDGNISNNKFECGCFLIPRKPHVLVLANCLPLGGNEGMTEGRILIYMINEKKELEKYTGDIPPNEYPGFDCDNFE